MRSGHWLEDKLVDDGVQRWTCMNIVINFGSHNRSGVFLYEVQVFFQDLMIHFLVTRHQCFGGPYLQMAAAGFSKPSVTSYLTACNHILREFHGQLKDYCLHGVNVDWFSLPSSCMGVAFVAYFFPIFVRCTQGILPNWLTFWENLCVVGHHYLPSAGSQQ